MERVLRIRRADFLEGSRPGGTWRWWRRLRWSRGWWLRPGHASSLAPSPRAACAARRRARIPCRVLRSPGPDPAVIEVDRRGSLQGSQRLIARKFGQLPKRMKTSEIGSTGAGLGHNGIRERSLPNAGRSLKLADFAGWSGNFLVHSWFKESNLNKERSHGDTHDCPKCRVGCPG
jgi:hypothetical protein